MSKQQLRRRHFDWSKYDYHLTTPKSGQEYLAYEGWVICDSYLSFEYVVRTPKPEQLPTPETVIQEVQRQVDLWFAQDEHTQTGPEHPAEGVIANIAHLLSKLPKEAKKLGDQ